MQTLTEPQAALLVGDRLEVSSGLEVLDMDLTVTADVSEDLQGGSIRRQMAANIHGTCNLTLLRELAWESVLVRPFMMLNGERWNCGVFSLATPEEPIGETPATFSVQGYDRLYLLDREVGDDYTVTAATDYRTALLQVFTDAGLSGVLIDTSAADFDVPVDAEWPLVGTTTSPDQTSTPVTWLRIVNDLLRAINFSGVWADQDGLFRCHRYIAPSSRGVEFTFDADDPRVSIVGEDRRRVSDTWKSPNEWVFIWSNRPGGESNTEGDGRYTVAASPEGLARRGGLVWPKVYKYEAASQAVLEELGNRRVAEDVRGTTTFKVTTGPFPAAGHNDVFSYVDLAAGGVFKVIARDWSYDLAGGDAQWTWEAVS